MNTTRKMLQGAGCVLEGEFFFALKTEGLVSKKYINIDPIFTRPAQVKKLGTALVKPFIGDFMCIVGPAVGGIPLVYAAGFAANEAGRHPATAFAEKEGAGFKFDRMGFAQAVQGRQTLVVEDISSTGKTTKSVCEVIRSAGGVVMGVSLVWNRGGLTTESLGVPRLHSLVTENVQTWKVDENPPGWGKLPLVSDIGHPEYYPDYTGPRISLL